MSRLKTLTTAEVGETLGLHPRTILAMVARGEFDGIAFRFSKRLRFDAEKLDAWIEARRVGGEAAGA